MCNKIRMKELKLEEMELLNFGTNHHYCHTV
jgi:hypothetical protein